MNTWDTSVDSEVEDLIFLYSNTQKKEEEEKTNMKYV